MGDVTPVIRRVPEGFEPVTAAEAILYDRLVCSEAEVERLREAYERDCATLRIRERQVERLCTALEDLCDRQHDYPTDLSNDRGWYEAFERARGVLGHG